MNKSLSENMEKIDYVKQPIKLAQSSQFFIDNLWKILAEVTKLYPPITSIFYDYYGFLVESVNYQLFIYKLIQGLTLTRFNLILPYQPQIQKIMRSDEQYSQMGTTLALHLLLDLAFPRVPLKGALPSNKKLANVPVPKLVEPQPEQTEIMDSNLKPLFQLITDIQTQLSSKLAPSIGQMSSTIKEYKELLVPVASLAVAKTILLNSEVPSDISPYRFVLPLEKPAAPSEPLELPLEKPAAPSEPFIEESLEINVEPGEEASGIKLSSKTVMTLSYAVKLPATISKKQKPFQKSLIYASQTASVQVHAPPSDGSFDTGIPIKSTSSVPLSLIGPLLGKKSTELTSWIPKEKATRVDKKANLLAFQSEVISAQKIVTNTLKRPIYSLKKSYSLDETKPKESYISAIREPEPKKIKTEAFRIPSILTSIMSHYTHSWLSSVTRINESGKTPFKFEQPISDQLSKPVDFLETKESAEPLVPVAQPKSDTLFTQRLEPQQESTEFISTVHLAQSTFQSVITELGASEPVRASRISDLAIGFKIPYNAETYTPLISDFPQTPHVGETSTLADERTFHSHLHQMPQGLKSVRVNVSTNKADLRNLETKIGRILSEQMAELGEFGPIRTTIQSELEGGFTTQYNVEPYTTSNAMVSRQSLIQSSITSQNQGVIHINVFDDNIGDMRELERKIRRILEDQLKRYYGSSKI